MSVLSALRSLPICRSVYREDTLPENARPCQRDRITLGWEERLKARARRTSDGGLQFGTALQRGSVLRAGDCLVVEEARVVVVVAELEEPVFVITPRTPAEWASCAYHIGNNHQPIMIGDEEIICPDLPGMEDLLRLHGIECVRAIRRFTPLGQPVDHRHLL